MWSTIIIIRSKLSASFFYDKIKLGEVLMKEQIILGVPHDGWSNISIGDFNCTASYITNVPFDILNNSIISLKEEMPFCLYLHLEAYGEVNIYSDVKTYIIHENSETDLYSFDIDKYELIKSFIKQLKDNIEDWSMWEDFEEENHEELEKNEKEILKKIKTIEDLLKEND